LTILSCQILRNVSFVAVGGVVGAYGKITNKCGYTPIWRGVRASVSDVGTGYEVPKKRAFSTDEEEMEVLECRERWEAMVCASWGEMGDTAAESRVCGIQGVCSQVRRSKKARVVGTQNERVVVVEVAWTLGV
jgi:hypothetical protein